MLMKLLPSGVVLLVIVVQVGCDSKPKGSSESGPVSKNAVAKVDSPKADAGGEKKPAPTKGGKDVKEKEVVGPDSGKKGGTPIEAATDLTRIEHKAFVIFYKGFTEDQMRAYIDHIDKFWTTGKEPRKTYGVFYYQVTLAKQNKGMRIVREDDFTKIMIPVEDRMKNDKTYFGNVGLPLCGSLTKIDETVKGKVGYAICNDDCTVIYKASDAFLKH